MRTRMGRMLGLAALTVLPAACGGGAATPTTAPVDAASAAAAIVASLLSDTEAAGPFDATQARCLADGVVAALGPERAAEILGNAGDPATGGPTVIFAQMTEEELARTMQVAVGCVDLVTAVPSALTSFGFGEEAAACLGVTLVPGGFGEAILKAYLGATDPTTDPGFSAAYVDALAGPCAEATRRLVQDDLIAFYEVSANGAACVADEFVAAANFREIVTVWMGVTDESMDAAAVIEQMTQVFMGCLTPEELTAMGIDTTSTTGG